MSFATALFQESPFLLAVLTLAFITLFISSYNVPFLFVSLFCIYVLTVLLLIWFYRHSNKGVHVTDGILSPCDGVVQSLEYDHASGRYKVVVFLNILDMHHQYYPATGIVIDSVHTPGSFHPAYILEKSKYNERHLTTIRTSNGEPITMTQIAGQVARRIVNNAIPGLPIVQGERMGMIKLSSRVDIEFSKAHFIPAVKPGMRITARQSVIANRIASQSSQSTSIEINPVQ